MSYQLPTISNHVPLSSPHQSNQQITQPDTKTTTSAKPKMTTPQTRTTYRSLLRLLPRRNQKPFLRHPPTPLHLRLRELYREPVESETVQQSKLHEAEQLATYAKAQKTYSLLLERYNPGMTLDEQEKIRLTARRVGMELPVRPEDGEGGKKGE